ncbi:MAG: C25 family cysteine peptidase [Methanobacteriota archaeon]
MIIRGLRIKVETVCILLITILCLPNFVAHGIHSEQFLSTIETSSKSSCSNTEFSRGVPNDQQMIIKYTFTLPTLRTVLIGDIKYTRIELPNAPCLGNPGDPLLPVYMANILIPSRKEVSSVDIILGDKVTIRIEKKIEPADTLVPCSQIDVATFPTPNPTIYTSAAPFPEKLFDQIGTQCFRGYRILSLSLYPIKYTPLTNILECYSEMTIVVRTHIKENTHLLYRGLEVDDSEVKEKIDNPEVIQTYISNEPAQRIVKKYDLLIITTDELKGGFFQLATVHNRRGISTIIKTLGADIPLGNTVNQTCENIRNFTREMYTTWGIEYLLLGGDIDLVPAPTLYFGYDYNNHVYGPSDFYYSCLDGPYNSNHNNRWGEATDGENGTDVDLRAEVYVGRACVGNRTEVGHFVNKTLKYLQMKNFCTINIDVYNNYLKKIVMAGEYLRPGQFGDTYLEQLINRTDNTVGIPADEYDIERLYDHSWPGFDPNDPWDTGWPKDEIINEINNGTHIINHLGHSGPNKNLKLDIGFSTTDVDRLVNDEPCFIYSQGCAAGAFDRDANTNPLIEDSIMEYFTVKREHGAFAGLWNTRDSYSGISTAFARWFWDGVIDKNITVLSKANQYSKEQNLPRIQGQYGQDWRWQCYQLNYFGDPTLSLQLALHAKALAPSEAVLNEPVSFTGHASGGYPPYKDWWWDFGDGNISKGQQANHTYRRVGNYTVNLTVHDSIGNVDTDTILVMIHRAVVWVDDNNTAGPWDGSQQFPFQRIQDGVDAVCTGGTVNVVNGTYYEHIWINKTLHLVGEEKNTTIIDSISWTNHSIRLRADRVTIRGLTIQHANAGIWLTASNCTIRDTIITDNKFGIYCTMRLTNITIHSNMILNNTWEGITLMVLYYSTVSRNVIIGNWRGVFVCGGHHNTISDNLIKDNNSLGILLDTTNNNTIIRNCIINRSYGIVSGRSYRNNISENLITGNTGDGIYLYSSSHHNMIQGNTVTNNLRNGIFLKTDSSNNTIVENTITNNTQCGIDIETTSDNLIYHNNFINDFNVRANTGRHNLWDNGYPCGGNYWSDWPCTGNPNDGSQPYIINEYNIDHHPFQNESGWN